MTFHLGPLAFQAAHLFFLSALLVAVVVGNWAGRKRGIKVGSVLLDMVLGGLIAGRIAFVILWFEQYRGAPWTMIDIRDGGLHLWSGLAAALLVGFWRVRQRIELREPLAAGLLAGAFAWLLSGAPTLLRMGQEKTIPAVALNTLAGKRTALVAIANGKPLVVNLWATWCPPCRREMPVLAAAQQRQDGIVFAFANQAESGEQVGTYLQRDRIRLSNVLLDPGKALGLAVGSTALPTTLFYDRRGKLVDVHLGPLSAASLEAKLAPLR